MIRVLVLALLLAGCTMPPATCICTAPAPVAAVPTPAPPTPAPVAAVAPPPTDTILQTKNIDGKVSTSPPLTKPQCAVAQANAKADPKLVDPVTGKPLATNTLTADCLTVPVPKPKAKP